MSISLLVFVLLSLINIILGIYSFISLQNSILIFLFISGIVPSGSLFNDFIYFKGILFSDFFLVFIFINYIFITLKLKSKMQTTLIIFCLVFLFLYLFPKVIYLGNLNKYLFKDFQPFIILIKGAIFFSIINYRKVYFSKNKLFLILITIFASKIILYFFIISSDNKTLNSTEDLYRYSDIGSLMAFSFLIIYLTIKDKYKIFDNKLQLNIAFLLALIVIAISTNRTIIFSVILIMFLFSNIRIYTKITSSVIFLINLYIIGYIFSVERILKIFDINSLYNSILIRFYPVIEHIRNMNSYQFIFGKGIGTTFYIPWFAYRENLDTILNNIDSTYITLYIKYGIFSVFLMIIYISSIVRLLPIKTKLAFCISILIMYFTMAIPYQITTFYFIVFCNTLASHILHSKNNLKEIRNIS